jgi:nanoRNase/pAp phosphatase (c-di-AMP/oligoRNAs hydrolase)
MTTRLVLGCESVAHALFDELRGDADELLVVSDDENRVDALRSEGVAAELGDYTDPATVATISDEDGRSVDSVVVAGAGAARNLRTAETAREAYPEAMILAYLGQDADDADREAIGAVADRLVDPTRVVADRVLSASGRESHRLRQLKRIIRQLDGPLAVVMHDNPDPDAIASAVALAAIADAAGNEADPCYYGAITHQENRALVNLLDYDLTNLEPGTDLSAYGGVALVDHSRPGVNDQLPPETTVDIVVDHHPPREPVEARFVDLRSDIGATSTLLADYFEQLRVHPSTAVATGLLYGIRIDTREFSREVSVEDFEAAAYLLPTADMEILERVESPSVSVDTLETIGRAISNRGVRGSVLTSCVGRLRSRDALAQAADHLLGLEGVSTTLVYGFQEGTIYASARARGTDLDVGETLREAFSRIGDAGGHADMAGAQIPLGLLGDDEESGEKLAAVVEDVITDRFFETLRSRPNWDVTGLYDEGIEGMPVGVGDEE